MTEAAPIKIVDLPEDCILVFMQYLAIVDLVCLRLTCKRMSYASRFRSLWYPIYQRFSKLVPMLPLPEPYSVDEMDDVPTEVLEYLSVYAYRLHVNFTQPMPTPSAVTALPMARIRPLDELHLLPGGRWLVGARYYPWGVSVWDLTATDEREDLSFTLSSTEHEPVSIASVTSAVSTLDGQLNVVLHGTKLVSPRSVSYKTVTRVSSMSLLRSGDPESCHDFKQGISRLPSITGLSGRTSPIDMKGSLLSFHVVDEEDVYVLDWTHNCVNSDPSAREDEETVNGVVLCASVLSELNSGTTTWTRVLATRRHTYLLCIAGDGTVVLFLVPPLSVALPGQLPRVQVAPIAQLTIESSPIEGVSYWSTRQAKLEDVYANLSLWTPTSVYNIILTPSRMTKMSINNYDDATALSPSTLSFSRTFLPITLDKRVTLCSLGPSGRRGIYVERSRYSSSWIELIIFGGRLPKIYPSYDPLVDHLIVDNEDEGITELPNPNVSRRVVLPGVASRMKQNINKVAFDECSGRVCLRHEEGAITIMDFSPLKVGMMKIP